MPNCDSPRVLLVTVSHLPGCLMYARRWDQPSDGHTPALTGLLGPQETGLGHLTP